MLLRMRDVSILNEIGDDSNNSYGHSKSSDIICTGSKKISEISNSKSITKKAAVTETAIATVTATETTTSTSWHYNKTSRKSAALNTTRGMNKIIFEITLVKWLSIESTLEKGEAWSKTIVSVMIITKLTPIYETKAKAEIVVILTVIVKLIPITKVVTWVISRAIGIAIAMTYTKRKWWWSSYAKQRNLFFG